MTEKKTLEELIQYYNECKEIFGDADFTSIMIASSICNTYCKKNNMIRHRNMPKKIMKRV